MGGRDEVEKKIFQRVKRKPAGMCGREITPRHQFLHTETFCGR